MYTATLNTTPAQIAADLAEELATLSPEDRADTIADAIEDTVHEEARDLFESIDIIEAGGYDADDIDLGRFRCEDAYETAYEEMVDQIWMFDIVINHEIKDGKIIVEISRA